MQGKGRRAPRISLSDTTPPAPPGFTNVKWQSDALGNRSGYVPEAGEGGSGGGAGNASELRLTLATGEPYYAPQHRTPTSTDTSAETVTFSVNHGWVTGTICTVSATGGGLTAGTKYYLRAQSSTSVSFHTTVADAEGNTNKVNLTASITAIVLVSGVEGTNLHLTPHMGNGLDVYDSGAWTRTSTAEVTKAAGTLTANLPYDVFSYLDTGSVVMELVAWSSDSARATALARNSGRWVKSGSTNLYMGTIRTNSTTTFIDDYGGIFSQTLSKRWVWNAYNQLDLQMFAYDGTSSWTYSTETWRAMNNNASNAVSWVNGLPCAVEAEVSIMLQTDAGGRAGASGVGFDVTNTPANGFRSTVGATAVICQTISRATWRFAPGYHFAAALEIGNGSATETWFGDGGLTGRWRSGVQGCCPG